MSIIHEALKKAAQESAQADSLSNAVTSKGVISGLKKHQDKGLSSVAPRLKRTILRRQSSKMPLSFYVSLVLTILLLALAGYFVKTYFLPVETESETVENIQSAAPVSVEEPANIQTRTEIKRDKPVRKKKPIKIPKIEITGVMMENPPKALINGHIIQEGSSVDGVKVQKIHADHIKFSYRGKRFSRLVD